MIYVGFVQIVREYF